MTLDDPEVIRVPTQHNKMPYRKSEKYDYEFVRILTRDEDRTPVDELSIPDMTDKPIQDRNAWDPVRRLKQEHHRPQTCGAIYERLMTQ